MHHLPIHQSQQAQITNMLLNNHMDSQVIRKDNLISLFMASQTTVLDNQPTHLGSQFIKTKGNISLLKVTQHLQCKELLFKVNLTINTNNLSNIDYYQVNKQIIINFCFFNWLYYNP